MRATGPFWTSKIEDTMGLMGGDIEFHAVTTCDEVVEITRKPKVSCSGQGAVAIPGRPPTRPPARHRLPCVHPRQLESVLESMASICTEVIDGF